MGKAVLISIRPQWCEKIASGEKTLEIRKTKPNLKTPFRCYIYCTAGCGENTFNVPISRDRILEDYINTGSMACLNCHIGNEKVVGEFICDTILSHCEMANADIAEAQGCIRREKILEYSCGRDVYGWHISELNIYDKPKELREFRRLCVNDLMCESCAMFRERAETCGNDALRLKRPPQSWCYVEEMNEGKK